MNGTYRIMIAKVGCDIHERGALTMLNAYRDAGYEVIYTGRFQSEESVAKAAIAEDVDMIAVSDYTGSLPVISKKLMGILESYGEDIPIICGGLMDADDIAVMKAMGIKGCYPTGSSIEECLIDTKEILA